MPDVATTGWPALTVRIAWTLLANGVRVRSTVLRDARDHVLMHLPKDMNLALAEDRAAELTLRFVARARRRVFEDPWPGDMAMPLSPRWRRAIDRSMTPLLGTVFRQHYGDGRSLDHLERNLGVDRIALEAARGGLREVLRKVGGTDGLPMETWPSQRIDRLLQRLAAWSPGPCPPVLEIVDGHHREHVGNCPRCDRTYRLVQNEVLTAPDLVPPLGGTRPQHTVRILALHLHPDGKKHRDIIAREAAVPCFPVGDDLLLLDMADVEPVRELLTLTAELGTPSRDHLRGVILDGPGRWSAHGLLGPLVDKSEYLVRPAAWGTIETIGELPPMMPVPPNAKRWWTAVLGVAAIGAAFAGAALVPDAPRIAKPADVAFTAARGGAWATVEVDDEAALTIVRLADGQLDPILVSTGPAEKGKLATGDGAYRLHAMGQGLLVVSTDGPIRDWSSLLEGARKDPHPLEALQVAIQTREPSADVHSWTAGETRFASLWR